MSVQVIKQGDKPEWAVVPYKTYLELVEKAEMLQDVQEYDSAKAALERGMMNWSQAKSFMLFSMAKAL
jgi:hypothetical protein